MMEVAKAQSEALGVSLNAFVLLALADKLGQTGKARARPSPPARAKTTSRPRPLPPPVVGRQVPPAAVTPPPGLPPHDGRKIGRNDLCPCGSGRKAKHCHPAVC